MLFSKKLKLCPVCHHGYLTKECDYCDSVRQLYDDPQKYIRKKLTARGWIKDRGHKKAKEYMDGVEL